LKVFAASGRGGATETYRRGAAVQYRFAWPRDAAVALAGALDIFSVSPARIIDETCAARAVSPVRRIP
jgi:hypothetical protein